MATVVLLCGTCGEYFDGTSGYSIRRNKGFCKNCKAKECAKNEVVYEVKDEEPSEVSEIVQEALSEELPKLEPLTGEEFNEIMIECDVKPENGVVNNLEIITKEEDVVRDVKEE